MTQFLNKSFSVHMTPGAQYRDNWDAIFKKKEPEPEPTDEPEPRSSETVLVAPETLCGAV